ncbi:CHASE3 domain-containing protein [Nonomuraea africana]|uniref:histidine kinase n=1 Tax=Nonomuraea africana TaxID=46171 RepID=A0ABR9KMW1_9ACTN|nr:ATP-binding protein [Nonomuraea africana]MBE1563356.1 signal transduction histidine kinase [Nonomuraea africana]
MARPRPLPPPQPPIGYGRLPIGRWFVFAGVVGLLVLVAGAMLTTGTLTRFSEARHEVIDVVDPAALATLDLSVALTAQEDAVRSFGLTADSRYLSAYARARSDEKAALGRIERLVPGPRLEAVRQASAAWRTQSAEPVLGGAAPTKEHTEVNDLRFGEVRAALNAQRAHLESLHAAKSRQLEQRASTLTFALGMLAAVLVGVLVLIGLIVRHVVLLPVAELTAQVRAVAQGDFDRSLKVDRPAELSELSGHIDAMRRRILAQWRRSEEQAEELRRSNGELEQFAYVASHDLQEPLRKVASFTQMLEQRYGDQLDDRAKQYISFAVDGAKRMQALINDLLDFSRVGRIGGEKVPLDSALPLADALHNLAARVAETGARVTHGPLPEVVGNRSQLTQVFQNLIGNAIKFRGDEPPAVHIEAREVADDMWEFSCADNGIGIEEKYADKIFLIFQRLHTRDRYPGTGIGLAVCRKIVDYHGGRIWLDSQQREGRGATVRWTLPGRSHE